MAKKSNPSTPVSAWASAPQGGLGPLSGSLDPIGALGGFLGEGARLTEKAANTQGLSFDPRITAEERSRYLLDDRSRPEAKRFRQEVANTFVKPIIPYNGKKISAFDQIRFAYVDSLNLKTGEEKLAYLAKGEKLAIGVLEYLQGERDPSLEENKVYVSLANEALDRIKEVSETAASSKDVAVDDLEYEGWRQEERRNPNGLESNYRLNEAGQAAWQLKRDYNILRAATDGRHTPDYARSMSPAYQILGSVLEPLTGPITAVNTLAEYKDALVESLATGNLSPLKKVDPLGNFQRAAQSGRDNDTLARENIAGGMIGRLRQALYWHDRSKDARQTRDSITGSNFPERSMATATGAADSWSNYSNPYTRFSSALQIPAYNPDKILSAMAGGDELQNIQDLNMRVRRDTPIIPKNATAKVFDVAKAKEASEDQEAAAASWATNNYARAPYFLNQNLGTSFKPSFLSPAAELGIDLTREIFSDPFSALQLPFAAARGWRNLAKHAGQELLEESGPEFAMAAGEYAGNTPEEMLQPNTLGYMMTPATENYYMKNPDGTPFRFPSSPTDDTAYKKALTLYGKTLQTKQNEVNDAARTLRFNRPAYSSFR